MNGGLSRQRLILLGLILCLFFAGAIALIIHASHSSPEYTQTVTDKDTGEKASFQPNKNVEPAAGGGNVVIFGSTAIINDGATEAQFLLFKKLLNQFSNQVLRNSYQTITIIPNSINADAGDIKAKLRLGQDSTELSLEVKLSNLTDVQVIVTDPSGHYQRFDSGVQRIPSS